MDYAVNGVASAGNYTLTLYYASGETPRIGLSVNGTARPTLTPAGTGGWANFVTVSTSVALNAGNNTIRVRGDNGQFTLDKLCVDAGGTPPPPLPPPGNANYASALDEGSCQSVSGWAFNRNAPGQPIVVDIYLNGQLVQGGYATTVSWPDVASVYGTGSNNLYGFSWAVPAAYRTGGSVPVSVRYGGTNQEINGSPRSAGACNGSRIAADLSEWVDDGDRDSGLVISPNPSSGRVLVGFRLSVGDRATLSVQSLTGAVLQSRLVVGTGAVQTEVLDLERESSGLYLIRVSGGTGKAASGRVLLVK